MGITFADLKAKVQAWYYGRTDIANIIPDACNIALHKVEREYSFRGMIKHITPTDALLGTPSISDIITVDTLPGNPEWKFYLLPNGDLYLGSVLFANVGVPVISTPQQISQVLPSNSPIFEAPSDYKELVDEVGVFYIESGTGIRHELIKDATRHSFVLWPDLVNDVGVPQSICYTPRYTDANGLTVFAWLLRPTPIVAGSLDITYYAYSPDLVNDTDTNHILNGAWEMLLYGAMSEIADMRGNTQDMQKWAAMRDEVAKGLSGSEAREKFSGSPKVMKNAYKISGKIR